MFELDIFFEQFSLIDKFDDSINVEGSIGVVVINLGKQWVSNTVCVSNDDNDSIDECFSLVKSVWSIEFKVFSSVSLFLELINEFKFNFGIFKDAFSTLTLFFKLSILLNNKESTSVVFWNVCSILEQTCSLLLKHEIFEWTELFKRLCWSDEELLLFALRKSSLSSCK